MSLSFRLCVIHFLVLLSPVLWVVEGLLEPLVVLVIHWINNIHPPWFGNMAQQPALWTDSDQDSFLDPVYTLTSAFAQVLLFLLLSRGAWTHLCLWISIVGNLKSSSGCP